MTRRDFIKFLSATALLVGPVAESFSSPLGDRKALPLFRFNGLWLARDRESFLLDLRNVDHYKQACWLLRDKRANDRVMAASPWLLHTAAMMQAVVAHYVKPEPFQVLSGLRMPDSNRRAGGCKNSFHLPDARGMFYAMDVRMDGLPTETLGKLGLFLKQGGVGIYHSNEFVHLDVGNPRTWEKL